MYNDLEIICIIKTTIKGQIIKLYMLLRSRVYIYIYYTSRIYLVMYDTL